MARGECWMLPSFIHATREGLLLEVHVQPNAKVAGIVGMHGDRLKVTLRKPPQDGKANLELIALMAEALDLPKSSIALVRGATSRQKALRITGISAEQLRQRVASDPES